MPRKSAASLDVVVPIDIRRSTPPAPPPELPPSQAKIWADCVASMPGRDWTRGAHGLLVEYCRHHERAVLLERQIANFNETWTRADGGLERFCLLFAAAERETRAMVNLARWLRLSPQAQLDPKTAFRRIDALPPPGPKPWDAKA